MSSPPLNKRINEVAFPTLSDDGWEQFTRQVFKEVNGVPVLDYDPRISEAVNAEDSDEYFQLAG